MAEQHTIIYIAFASVLTWVHVATLCTTLIHSWIIDGCTTHRRLGATARIVATFATLLHAVRCPWRRASFGTQRLVPGDAIARGEHPKTSNCPGFGEDSWGDAEQARMPSECQNDVLICAKRIQQTCNYSFWAFYPLYKISVFCVVYLQCTWWTRSRWISLLAACYLWRWQLKMARRAAEVLQNWWNSLLCISTAFKSCRFVWFGDFGDLELQVFGALDLPQTH